MCCLFFRVLFCGSVLFEVPTFFGGVLAPKKHGLKNTDYGNGIFWWRVLLFIWIEKMGAQLGIERTPTSHFVTLNCEAVLGYVISKILLVVLQKMDATFFVAFIGRIPLGPHRNRYGSSDSLCSKLCGGRIVITKQVSPRKCGSDSHRKNDSTPSNSSSVHLQIIFQNLSILRIPRVVTLAQIGKTIIAKIGWNVPKKKHNNSRHHPHPNPLTTIRSQQNKNKNNSNITTNNNNNQLFNNNIPPNNAHSFPH